MDIVRENIRKSRELIEEYRQKYNLPPIAFDSYYYKGYACCDCTCNIRSLKVWNIRITINRGYLLFSWKEVKKVILHELAHAILYLKGKVGQYDVGHGQEYLDLMYKIGGDWIPFVIDDLPIKNWNKEW